MRTGNIFAHAAPRQGLPRTNIARIAIALASSADVRPAAQAPGVDPYWAQGAPHTNESPELQALSGCAHYILVSVWGYSCTMATKAAKDAKAALKTAREAEQGRPLAVRVVVDPTDDTPSYYVNYAEAAMAVHELALSFLRVPTKMGVARSEEIKTSGLIRMEPAVQVVFAPTLLPGLIRALTTIKGKYEEKFGQIKEPGGENG